MVSLDLVVLCWLLFVKVTSGVKCKVDGNDEIDVDSGPFDRNVVLLIGIHPMHTQVEESVTTRYFSS